MIGSQISSYRIIEELGVGGFGTVYKAEHVDLEDLFVAVKVMHPHQARDQMFITSLKQECRVLNKLQHPNIVGFREFFFNHDPPAIIMEYLEGEDAEEQMKRQALSLELVEHIARECLKALQFAHEKQIIHRDIKPSNIFLCKDGTVKIADFGVAKAFDSQNQTETGVLKGTLNYMAPELFLEVKATAGTDIYALGLTLWELLAGEMACPSGSLITKINWHRDAKIQDVRALRADCPDWMAEVVMKMCGAGSQPRPTSAKEALDLWNAQSPPLRSFYYEDDGRGNIIRVEGEPSGSTFEDSFKRGDGISSRRIAEILHSISKILAFIHRGSPLLFEMDIHGVYQSESGHIRILQKTAKAKKSKAEDMCSFGTMMGAIVSKDTTVSHTSETFATLLQDSPNVQDWGLESSDREKLVALLESNSQKRPAAHEIEHIFKSILFDGSPPPLEKKVEKEPVVRSKIETLHTMPNISVPPLPNPATDPTFSQEQDPDPFRTSGSSVPSSQRSSRVEPKKSGNASKGLLFLLGALLLAGVGYWAWEFSVQNAKRTQLLEEAERLGVVDESKAIDDIAKIQADVERIQSDMKRLHALFEEVSVSAGSFVMGCSAEQGKDCDVDEKPSHEVQLTRSMLVMKGEVSQALYTDVMGVNPSFFQTCGDNCPVENVSWFDAIQFANALSLRMKLDLCYEIEMEPKPRVTRYIETCKGYRLPTEAEWEYLARGGEEVRYAGSNTTDDVANLGVRTQPSCSKKENGYALCDMSGNVWEWVFDASKRAYQKATTNPVHLIMKKRSYHVRRGGGINGKKREARVSNRSKQRSVTKSKTTGFRCVRLQPKGSTVPK
ncbi:MAG: bifunctional serine/threonine-protein kinase/formylglycine-generating enzyme family protein [Myxococcota bacterium]|nr:bifunctional serine/threonine-protein kinase/formylglycine-generating enzyme family protein [Myxococcota bacterium]